MLIKIHLILIVFFIQKYRNTEIQNLLVPWLQASNIEQVISKQTGMSQAVIKKSLTLYKSRFNKYLNSFFLKIGIDCTSLI